MSITNFHGEQAFLSNFATSPIVLDGDMYPTVEHAFQEAKTYDPAERATIREAVTPAGAKHLGKRVALRADWEQVKFDLMLTLLRHKFVGATGARRCWTPTRRRSWTWTIFASWWMS
jgi:ribA/ribD-fused uncharacterized protein